MGAASSFDFCSSGSLFKLNLKACFVFQQVMVNGFEYKPSFVSPNKKHAKATAATVALQALGLVPKDLLANATNFRSASHN